MSTIRKLQENDIEAFVGITVDAYCGFGVSEEVLKKRRKFFHLIVTQLPDDDVYGVYRNEQLVGGMRLIDYKLTCLSSTIDLGGIGSVAVGLLHRKEKVARDLITYACHYFRDKGFGIIALYPFRVDFYKKMGFGYGTTIRQYRIEPSYFPKGDSKQHLVYLTKDDKALLTGCYNRVVGKTHGMIKKIEPDYRKLFLDERRIVGVKQDNTISGYIHFSYQTEQPFKNHILIHEFVYETKEALLELCTFLHTQADQFERIIVNTQDENFHYLVANPANGQFEAFSSEQKEMSACAVGMMYRVVNVRRMFETLHKHNFRNQTCKLKLTIKDDFLESNNGSLIVHFENGIPTLQEEDYEVEILLNISEFSSLFMGAVSFKTLLRYGLAEISDPEYTNCVNTIFMTEQKPMSTTYF